MHESYGTLQDVNRLIFLLLYLNCIPPELYISAFPITLLFLEIRELHRVKSIPPWIDDIRNYKSYDPVLFKTDLNYVPWDILEIVLNFEEAWNSFKHLFKTAADNHAPVITHRVHERSLHGLQTI